MHQIKNLSIESSFNDRQQANHFQQEVGAFLQDSWQNSLSLWMDKICPVDQVITIDRLDVELMLDQEALDLEEWSQRVMKLIKEKIMHELALEAYSDNENISKISIEQSWLDQWMFFWQTGQLAWNALANDFDQLISIKLVQKHRQEITRRKRQLNTLMTNNSFFVRVFQSMEYAAFQFYIKLLKDDFQGLAALITGVRNIYTAISTKSLSNRDMGEFLAFFWKSLDHGKIAHSRQEQVKRNSIECLFRFWNSSLTSTTSGVEYEVTGKNIFISLINNLLVSRPTKIPTGWEKTLRYFTDNPGALSSKGPASDRDDTGEKPSKKMKASGGEFGDSDQEFYKTSKEATPEWRAEDAGVVLLHPYIQILFQEVGVWDEESEKIEQADVAVQVMHYLVYGSAKLQPHRLATVKILCGLDDNYVLREIELNKSIKKECDQLLESVIRHWKALKKTSPEGLRVSFLQRKGLLMRKDDRIELKVERKAYDILLDHLPWSYSIMKLPWMNWPVYVQW